MRLFAGKFNLLNHVCCAILVLISSVEICCYVDSSEPIGFEMSAPARASLVRTSGSAVLSLKFAQSALARCSIAFVG